MTVRPLSEVLREKWDEQTRQEALPMADKPAGYWSEVYDSSRAPGSASAAAPIPGFEEPKQADAQEVVSRVFPMDDLPGLLADPCPWEFIATGEYVNRQLGLTFKHEPGATQGVLTGPQAIVAGS